MTTNNDIIYDLLRSGITRDELYKHIDQQFSRIQEEDEAEKSQKVAEQEQKEKIAAARSELLKALITYFNALGIKYEITDEDIKEVEDSLKKIESLSLNKLPLAFIELL
jgi:small-conductance mechanosensitive channel